MKWCDKQQTGLVPKSDEKIFVFVGVDNDSDLVTHSENKEKPRNNDWPDRDDPYGWEGWEEEEGPGPV